MTGTWYTNVRDFLNEEGELAETRGPATAIAIFLRSVVGWVTVRHACPAERTNITCRRSPGRQRCLGEIEAYLLPDDGEIVCICPECGDHA
jgi:hypothetical protein